MLKGITIVGFDRLWRLDLFAKFSWQSRSCCYCNLYELVAHCNISVWLVVNQKKITCAGFIDALWWVKLELRSGKFLDGARQFVPGQRSLFRQVNVPLCAGSHSHTRHLFFELGISISLESILNKPPSRAPHKALSGSKGILFATSWAIGHFIINWTIIEFGLAPSKQKEGQNCIF